MTLNTEKMLDGTGWELLRALQEDARRPFTEIGRVIGLSSPAVADRARRLEDAGIITGYHAAVNPAQVGLPVAAFIRVTPIGERTAQIGALAPGWREVLECHRVTGSESYILKVAAASVAGLEVLIDRLGVYGQLNTSIVLSSPVARRTIAEG
jgi:Lrp/AsnC family leucine-responsive transcriptional regulator